MSRKEANEAALKQAGWTDEDICLLRYAIDFDKKVPFEHVLHTIGHCAEAHEDLVSAECLVALLKFTTQAYDGICKARFIINKDKGEIGKKADFYHRKLSDAQTLCESIKRKHEFAKSLATKEPMEAKGSIH